MPRIFRLLFWLIAGLYVIALLLFAVGTFGWFGQERDPLAPVFLVPLGLPWNRWLGGATDGLGPFLAAISPMVNLLIIRFIARLSDTATNGRIPHG